MACVIEARLRSKKSMNNADLIHASRALAHAPDSPSRVKALDRALVNKGVVEDTLAEHVAQCEQCQQPVTV